MRILLLEQFFDPEPTFKGLAFAKALASQGHDVEILTGFPNYPGGKVYAGYHLRLWKREVMDGVPVNRVLLYPSHNKSALLRILNYVSFALSASILGPLLVKRPDIVYVYHPPATIGLPAIVLRALWRVPFVYDVHDLWPDTVAASGMLNNRFVIRMLNRFCDWIYRCADRVVVVSRGFRRALIERGVPENKVHLIHNWADERSIRVMPRDEDLADRLGFSGRFNVLFAGTMGTAQALDAILDAAEICAKSAPFVQFAFVGGGVDKHRLEQRARAMSLTNVLFLPKRPMAEMSPLLALADVVLVHLKNDPLFRITIPSKTQAYMAAGRPILMAVPGDAAELVETARAGTTCVPEDAVSIAAAVQRLQQTRRADLEAMGARGKDYYYRDLSMAVGVDRYLQIFHSVLGHTSPRRRAA
jgi:colanic acid biosynthesis glycosyl transferase WcaI